MSKRFMHQYFSINVRMQRSGAVAYGVGLGTQASVDRSRAPLFIQFAKLVSVMCYVSYTYTDRLCFKPARDKIG